MTKQEMLKAIKDYFFDMKRSQEETREGLEEARDEIDTLLDSM